ncbi:MAG TPA: PDZ domain-containing protein [Chloroflexota bacterium]|nr:PDZ domain-containing protein [Chloroflexota bacterium]
MKRVLQFGLVLLTMAAAASPAVASSPSDPAGAAQFFLGNNAARQGYLGVDVRDIAPDQVSVLKLRDGHGAEIVMVDHDAPAGKCGLREHDVILQMNGTAIEGREQVRKMLHDMTPGKALQLVISRDGQQMTINTQMSSQEAVERQAWEQHLAPADPQTAGDPPDVAQAAPPLRGSSSKSFIGGMLTAPAYTGAMLEKMTAQLANYFGVPTGAGLLVRSVEPNSPAAVAGMHAGDVVVRAASHTVSTLGDWARALKSGKDKPVPVVVLRDKKEQTLMMTLDSKKRSSVEPADTSRLGLSFRGK